MRQRLAKKRSRTEDLFVFLLPVIFEQEYAGDPSRHSGKQTEKGEPQIGIPSSPFLEAVSSCVIVGEAAFCGR